MCGGHSMFDINKGVTKIDGINGIYKENNITNPSVRYGRNSVQNFYSYLEQPIIKDNNATPPILDFGITPEATDKNIELMEKYTKENDEFLNALPPLEYEYRYMPNLHRKGKVDTNAVLGAAYEELGARKEVSVDDLNKSFGVNDEFTTNPMDINKDGKIDIGEYGSSILAADMLSKQNASVESIDGTINNIGHSAVQELARKSNAEAATKLYSSLYNRYKLGDAADKFNPK